MSNEYLFISDCHLDTRRPDVTAALLDFLQNRAPGANFLYILGDLFEVWLGDDDPAPQHQGVIEALRQLALKVDVFFMAGNRDFLLGQAFARHVNMTLLDEPHMLQLDRDRVVLVHGDTLCTDDRDYQEFRSMVRSPAWQSNFLEQPLAERQQIAAQLRADSVDAMSSKSNEIMDVNSRAVENCFRSNQASIIIHGHTHRPAIHQYDSNLRRIVLGDWGREPSYLSWTPARGFVLRDPRL